MSVVELVEGILAIDWATADQHAVARASTDVRRVRGWLDSIDVAAARRLTELAETSPSMYPERVAADAGRVSLTEASRSFDRAKTVTTIPQLGVALQLGDLSGGHVDVVTRAMRQLTSDQRDRLAERGDVLALAAASLPRDDFARTVRAEVCRLHTDDGTDRLQRQRRNTSLRTWVDRDSGMWCLRGEFDPETGAMLAGRLRNAMQALFHDAEPDTCPADPLLKQHHLRALALYALTEGRGGPASPERIDMSVLIDAKTLLHGEHPSSVIDYGSPIDLPIEVLRRWACPADISPIIVGADGVSLYLGRNRRIANRAQRRALRAMYRHCAIPGCRVDFDNCNMHHLTWFRHHGRTDIDNLLPLCGKHHHLVHEGGWKVQLTGRRNLTITYPDGSIMTTGPPSARAG